MQTIIKKFKLLYVPFLIIAISFISLYTFLNWLLIIKLHLFSFTKDIINFGVPFALVWIPILIWLRPRIRLLDLKGERNDYYFLYQLLSCLAIAAPTIIAQEYIGTETGKLTKLENIDQLTSFELTKYYALTDFFIDKNDVGVHTYFSVNGKHNENFNMQIFVVMPILSTEQDTAKHSSQAWLGVVYSDQISNRIDDSEKDTLYKQFAEKTQREFDNTNFRNFTYLEKTENDNDQENYLEALKKSPKHNTPDVILFKPQYGSYENRSGNSFRWIFISFAIGAIAFLLLFLIPKFDNKALRFFESGQQSNKKEFKDLIEFLKPKEGYFITPILIYLNIGIFLIMAFAGLGFISFKTKDLLEWGANYRPITTNGQWWRLLTNTFLHGGLMHVVANMYGLLFVGIFLEPLLGKTKYLILYLLTGILASCASLWWYDATGSVGASGAIFGLYGIFLALLLTKVFPPDFGKAFLASTLVFIGYNLLMGLTGGIDNAAHIGGLLSGFIIGLILYPTLKRQTKNKDV
jgi:rhomboid protease GluP